MLYYSFMVAVDLEDSISDYLCRITADSGYFVPYNMNVATNFTNLREYKCLVESSDRVDWNVIS